MSATLQPAALAEIDERVRNIPDAVTVGAVMEIKAAMLLISAALRDGAAPPKPGTVTVRQYHCGDPYCGDCPTVS